MRYDCIIVGAGSAGAVLASRLAEDRGRSVLLLEAGPDYPDFQRLPNELKFDCNQAASQVNAPHNWSLLGRATPQQARPVPVPRGRVTGGTSAINHQIFLRGAPEDFDHWASLGNPEWSYLKVLPYFRKLETDQDISGDFHGSSGPIPVRRHPRNTWNRVQSAFFKAATAVGFPEDQDLNHPEATGVGAVPLNNPGGVRLSTALAYLSPVRHRLNLTIKPNATARRILFQGNRATAAEVECGGETFVVEGGEIILSAGAVASPQLLMLSGVGPADQLQGQGIDLRQHLPGVGRNLKNHPSASVRFRTRPGFSLSPDSPRNQVLLRLTAPGSNSRNDIQIQPTTSAADGRETGEIRFGCRLELPASVGELRLASPDYRVQPHLDYQFLVEPWDRQRLREAVRICVRLVEHPAFAEIAGERISPTDAQLASDDALDSWLQHTVGIAGHTSGTCKMGPDTDPRAVVDQYCRVHGLEGLRVVDASVFPEIPRSNTNATVIMVGERVADMIRQSG